MWRILLLDTKSRNPNHYLMLCVKYALEKHQDVDVVVVSHYGNAIENAIKNKCNLFIAFDGEEIEPIICSRLKDICKRSVVWFVEDPYEININKEKSKYFDIIFTNDKGSVEQYKPYEVYHLPLAASEDIHYIPISNEHRYDLFFAGTAWPNRIETLKKIEGFFSDIKLKLALPTNEYLPKISLNLEQSEYNWKTPNNEFARFSNQSKITLSLHRKFTASEGKEEALTPGPRLFEVALASSLQLIDRSIPGITDYFIEDVDYVAFSSPEECIEKIQYYLENDEERNKIILSAQKKVKSYHTYNNRVEFILNKVKSISTSNDRPKSNSIKNILVVSHNVKNYSPFGGVEVYIDSLNSSLKDKVNYFYYIPNKDKEEGVEYLLLDNNYNLIERISFFAPLPTVSEHMLSCEQRESRFASVLAKYNIDLVHYQHLIRHIPSLPFISKALGVPSILTIHDFFPISHRFNLVDNRGDFNFDIFSPNSVNIDILLSDGEGIEFGSHSSRYAFWSNLLNCFDLIHYNSETTKNYIERIYPKLSKMNCVTRGIPFVGNFLNVAKYNLSKGYNDKLNVIVIGNFTRIKGADTLLRVFNMTRNSNLNISVYGRIDSEFSHIISLLNFEHVKFYGEYKNSELKHILKDQDVSLHLSTWPETFCITLSEVWSANIIPIVTNIGAFGERVKDELGYKVDINDVGSIVSILNILQIDREKLENIRQNINKFKDSIESLDTHKTWMMSVYDQMLLGRPVFSPLKEYKNNINLFACNVHLNSVFWAKRASENISVVNTGIPKSPIHLIRFVVFYAKQNGIKNTIIKIKSKLKSKIKSYSE